ncbi:hypothetical protein GCK32_013218 [Trichostrongylus colubriformis]|uniref:AMP-dependent synthetase/ligase domain-containing protein n=1 Tax=Trichostrongylus colubriformis TaxID=6319 RepID=A0AAN8F720_TRICO
MLCMDNSPQAVYLFLAVSLAGAVACTLSPKLYADEMHFQLVESDCRIAFADPMAIPELQKVFRNLNKPHRIMCAGPRDLSDGYPIIEDLQFLGDSSVSDDVMLPRIQPRHDIVYLPFSSGIHGKRKGILTTHYVRTLYLSPMIMSMMITEAENHEYSIEDLRTVISGSAAVSKDLFDDFRETFPYVRNIISTYGMTETGLITRTMPSEKYSTSCGKLAANLSLKVVDLINGRVVGPYQKGVIYVKGVSVMSPYLNNEEATREQIRGAWRKTGELQWTAMEISDPHCSVVLRILQKPVAFVVLDKEKPASTKQIMDYVNERVVRYKRLAQVNVAQTLPRSPCGSLLRRLLAQAAVLNVCNMP